MPKQTPTLPQPIPIATLHSRLGMPKPLTQRQVGYWRDVGIRGSKLKMFKLGNHWFTTAEAIEKFIAGQQR